DQFAVADARYWKLQRQLIDLEMSQHRQEDSQRLPSNDKSSNAARAGGWDVQEPEDIDLASPPTPTRKKPSQQMTYGIEPPGGRRLVRRPSAFSIADPVALQEQHSTQHAVHIPAAMVTSGQEPARNGIAAAAAPPITTPDTMNRSASSPRLASMVTSEETRRHRAPVSGLIPPNGDAGASVQLQPQPESPSTPAVLTSPGLPKRSRSYSTLLRIATEKNAQAAVLPKKPESIRAQEVSGPTFAAEDTTIPLHSASGTGERDVDDDADGDSGVDSENDKNFLSATGRAPTPYPRGLLRRKERVLDNGAEDDSATSDASANASNQATLGSESTSLGRRRNIPESLQIDASTRGFEPTQFDMSPASAGTPMTPGRQKIRPTINWGDDDGDEIPADNDMSLNAQWLRIIKGAPPARAPLFKAKTELPSQKLTSEQPATEPVSETEDIPNGDGAETPMEINIDELTIATKESLNNSSSSSDSDKAESDPDISTDLVDDAVTTATEHTVVVKSPSASAVVAESPKQPLQRLQQQQQQQKPLSGTRAPPRKLHSTKSFLNLTSKTYDT
ncbi:hypothetical protein LPJ73_006452, partial [Coemansia sp. RSA 2703]